MERRRTFRPRANRDLPRLPATISSSRSAGVINDAAFLPHFVQPATFMHELGHNLGLRHDGHIDNQCKDRRAAALGTLART